MERCRACRRFSRRSRRGKTFLGLLTGNFRDGARSSSNDSICGAIFSCGAFGDDSPDRNALVPVALERAAACGMAPLQPADVIVVGDTPNDVACAQVVGAVLVGGVDGELYGRRARAARRSCSRRSADAVVSSRSSPEGRAKAGGSAWESNPARPHKCGRRPVLKTGRATGPHSLPLFRSFIYCAGRSP